MASGEVLEIITDDPRALRDIPKAAEGEGYAVITNDRPKGPSPGRIVIER